MQKPVEEFPKENHKSKNAAWHLLIISFLQKKGKKAIVQEKEKRKALSDEFSVLTDYDIKDDTKLRSILHKSCGRRNFGALLLKQKRSFSFN